MCVVITREDGSGYRVVGVETSGRRTGCEKFGRKDHALESGTNKPTKRPPMQRRKALSVARPQIWLSQSDKVDAVRKLELGEGSRRWCSLLGGVKMVSDQDADPGVRSQRQRMSQLPRCLAI